MRSAGFIPASYCQHTVQARRDQVQVGQVIQSSHGYRLLIARVGDDAPVRTDERSVDLRGYLHAKLTAPMANEISPVTSLVTVEMPDSRFRVKLVTLSGRKGCTWTVDAMNPEEAAAQAIVQAHADDGDTWLLRSIPELIA
jgi:hypothetical protein